MSYGSGSNNPNAKSNAPTTQTRFKCGHLTTDIPVGKFYPREKYIDIECRPCSKSALDYGLRSLTHAGIETIEKLEAQIARQERQLQEKHDPVVFEDMQKAESLRIAEHRKLRLECEKQSAEFRAVWGDSRLWPNPWSPGSSEEAE